MYAHNKAAISIILNYAIYLESISEWRGYSFEELSYSWWSINEILERLQKIDVQPPLLVIENFRDEMVTYSCLNDKSGLIFSVACSVAEDIIDSLIS